MEQVSNWKFIVELFRSRTGIEMSFKKEQAGDFVSFRIDGCPREWNLVPY
jgi:hypothetical protein